MTDQHPALSMEEFASLREVSKGDLGYAVRRLGELGLTTSGLRRLAQGE